MQLTHINGVRLHVGGEEDIVGREVSMKDGRKLVVYFRYM